MTKQNKIPPLKQVASRSIHWRTLLERRSQSVDDTPATSLRTPKSRPCHWPIKINTGGDYLSWGSSRTWQIDWDNQRIVVQNRKSGHWWSRPKRYEMPI